MLAKEAKRITDDTNNNSNSSDNNSNPNCRTSNSNLRRATSTIRIGEQNQNTRQREDTGCC